MGKGRCWKKIFLGPWESENTKINPSQAVSSHNEDIVLPMNRLYLFPTPAVLSCPMERGGARGAHYTALRKLLGIAANTYPLISMNRQIREDRTDREKAPDTLYLNSLCPGYLKATACSSVWTYPFIKTCSRGVPSGSSLFIAQQGISWTGLLLRNCETQFCRFCFFSVGVLGESEDHLILESTGGPLG